MNGSIKDWLWRKAGNKSVKIRKRMERIQEIFFFLLRRGLWGEEQPVQENLFEVYPVGDGSLDEIVGVVYLKDLFGKLDKEKFSLDDIIRPVQYFHEYTDVYKVLEQMKKAHVTYGLVCDEFGVCQGIVTYKDILEGLVGSIVSWRAWSARSTMRRTSRTSSSARAAAGWWTVSAPSTTSWPTSTWRT